MFVLCVWYSAYWNVCVCLMHSRAPYFESRRHYWSSLSTNMFAWGGGWGWSLVVASFRSFASQNSHPHCPPARRAQKDGWIPSINNQQSKAKTTMFSSQCFVSMLAAESGCPNVLDPSHGLMNLWRTLTERENESIKSFRYWGGREHDQIRKTCPHKSL